MAGVTFLAFGNGSPDVFSTFAAMNSHSGSLAVGELIGAAGFITAVVAGSMALVKEFKVGKKTFVRDVSFFIVAAAFSMFFLADGSLHFWECCVMVGYYAFYVVTVVVWHWYLGRKRAQREREAAARGHYLAVSNEEVELQEEDDEDAPTGPSRRSTEDFAALERGSSPGIQINDDSDGDEDIGLRLQAKMANDMRLTRPAGSRRNTITPIRPSLVGALEFRSVLSSLQKSRGSHARPIHLRRYSDDLLDRVSEDGTQLPYSDENGGIVVTPADDTQDPATRARAKTLNSATQSHGHTYPNPAAYDVAHIPDIGILAATPTFPSYFGQAPPHANRAGNSTTSPTLSIPVSPTNTGSGVTSPVVSHERYGDTLAPPNEVYPAARQIRQDFSPSQHSGNAYSDSPHGSPQAKGRETGRPRLQIPGGTSRESSHSRTLSPTFQFPPYTDSPAPMSAVSSKAPSLMLPDAETLTPPSTQHSHEHGEMSLRPIRWWPYRVLPSPHVLASTLFPTLYTWKGKSVWDKFVSIISAPSIFLLAITLPVVESEVEEEDEKEEQAEEMLLTTPSRRASNARGMSIPTLIPDSPTGEEPEYIRYRRATRSGSTVGSNPHSPLLGGLDGHDAASVAVSAENLHSHHYHNSSISLPSPKSPGADPAPVKQNYIEESSIPKDWNRWLVSLQIFTAPLFVVTIVWANQDEAGIKLLVNLVLFSLLGSLITFAILVLTTSPTEPPKYRFVLCFLGFVVAIAWISTIANEVVGVLKAFGVILGISDAILGLTIFAVGNSLGDLVADITVARLGYPVMALSACFGGPMLNILLGIGISGIYMTYKEANDKHHKHPNKKLRYKPYQIEVSGTLLISAVTLIITLIGLLIAVPLNKWIMSRRIGYGLIGLWTISTIVNLAVEVSGVWGDIKSIP